MTYIGRLALFQYITTVILSEKETNNKVGDETVLTGDKPFGFHTSDIRSWQHKTKICTRKYGHDCQQETGI